MTLLVAMLPFYLLGNLHCLGMCGPLAMMLGKHRYRFYYFGGRLLSFTLAGALAGEIGAVINVFFNAYHVGAAASLLFGSAIFMMGLFGLFGRSYPGQAYIGKLMARANGPLSLLMLRDLPLATFMFGFLAIALPCGQSLVVFSACALSGSVWVGMINGFAFAALTSPSLYFAMNAHAFLGAAKKYYNSVSSVMTLLVGIIALCRAFAELDLIPHVAWSLPVVDTFHIALF
jgi:sulfite exporter TauE/SafE